MIFHRLKLINKKQQGFTLVELMLAMALSGIITGIITMTIFQMVNGSTRTNNHMIAVRQAQEAGFFFSRDAQMVQQEPVIVKNVDDELESITLTWTDWGGTVNVVTYTLVGTELLRNNNPVAKFINPDPAKTNCYLYECLICGERFASLAELEAHFDSEHPSEELEDNYESGKLIFMVTATVGSGSQAQSETRTYEIVPRPGS